MTENDENDENVDLFAEWDLWDEAKLTKLALINAVTSNKMKAELELESLRQLESHKRITEKTVMEQHGLKKKYLELQNLHMREMMRPYKLNHAVVGYDPTEKKYACAFVEADGLYNPIVAYGDTPGEACDNFDLLWMGLQDDE
jgi:hypothetical protein